MYSRSELAAGFRKLGVVPGDTVMLHASVRSVGAVDSCLTQDEPELKIGFSCKMSLNGRDGC